VQVFPQSNLGETKALANVVLNDQLLVRGLRVVEGYNGLYVSFPKELCGNTPRAVLFPVTRQLREHIENCVLEKYQAAIGSTEAPERDDGKYAVVETIDYNNGETPAESNILAIDCKQACEERFADLKAAFTAVGKGLLDEGDTFFRIEDEATGEKRSYAIKLPKAK
jgi:stage V sporulation protein G